MSLSAAERETTLTIDDEAQVWLVSSHRRADITKLKKNPDLVIEEEGTFEGTPFIRGTLPIGGIAFRAKSAGSITRKASGRKGRPNGVLECGEPTAKGTPCRSIASKATGKCAKHSK